MGFSKGDCLSRASPLAGRRALRCACQKGKSGLVPPDDSDDDNYDYNFNNCNDDDDRNHNYHDYKVDYYDGDDDDYSHSDDSDDDYNDESDDDHGSTGLRMNMMIIEIIYRF